MKNFLKFSSERITIFIFLICFAPVYFMGLYVAGFAPTIFFIPLINYIVVKRGDLNMLVPMLISFVIHLIVYYVVACAIYRVVSKISDEKSVQWSIIICLGVLLVIMSFFKVYYLGGIGGGGGPINLIGLFDNS